MTKIVTEIRIEKPIRDVFDFLTTPQNWPRWHPSCIKVEGAVDHSLNVGEQVTEHFRVAGQRGEVTWIVRERNVPYLLKIEGKVKKNLGGGTIIHRFAAKDETSTLFTREVYYYFSIPLVNILDFFIFRKRIEKESQLALKQLKIVLEERIKV